MSELYDALVSDAAINLMLHAGLGAIAGYCIGSSLKESDINAKLNISTNKMHSFRCDAGINIHHHIEPNLEIHELILHCISELFHLLTKGINSPHKTLKETMSYIIQNHTYKICTFTVLTVYGCNLINSETYNFCAFIVTEYASYKISRMQAKPTYYNETDREAALKAIHRRNNPNDLDNGNACTLF